MSTEPENRKKEKKPRSRLRRVLVVLLLLDGVYCAAGSGLLSSGLVEKWLNRRPEKMTISWAWAWTPVPAVFVVHDLELSGQNPRRQWALAVDR
ncbi:MAG: hypothetical protein GY856_00100, partial [bacterium]|nr:hypothetical protein [bacterium]